MQQKIKELQALLGKNKLDGLLVSNVANIIYLTGFSSFDPIEREAFLLITKNQNYVFTDARYSEAVEVHVADFKLIENIQAGSFLKNFEQVVRENRLKKVGFESANLSVVEHTKIRGKVRIIPTKNLIESLRVIKDIDEIEKIKKACEIGDEAFKFILTKIRSGVSEKEIAFELEMFFRKQNAGFSFSPLVAFGPHSSTPHHKSIDTKLKINEIVLLDFGVKYENYCSDMTRTVYFGKASDEFKKIYQTVLNSQKTAMEYLDKTKSPSLKIADKVARDYVISKRYPTIPHSLGHGVGVEIHEAPRLSPKSKEKAKNNMVFSVEPGIYIKEFGGVRIEDLVLYKNGAKLLTHSTADLIEI
jgi:Xaa-Pro aminopeptidase